MHHCVVILGNIAMKLLEKNLGHNLVWCINLHKNRFVWDKVIGLQFSSVGYCWSTLFIPSPVSRDQGHVTHLVQSQSIYSATEYSVQPQWCVDSPMACDEMSLLNCLPVTVDCYHEYYMWESRLTLKHPGYFFLSHTFIFIFILFAMNSE